MINGRQNLVGARLGRPVAQMKAKELPYRMMGAALCRRVGDAIGIDVKCGDVHCNHSTFVVPKCNVSLQNIQ